MPNSCIFWWFPTIYFSYVSYCLPVFFLAPHYFQFLSFLGKKKSLLLAILDFMLIIPISPLIAACAAHFGAFKILLIAVFMLFTICLFLLLSCLLLLIRTERLVAPPPFQYVFPIITRWQLFRWQSLSSRSINLLIFFIILIFCPSNTFLFACTITPKYFIYSTTSILLTSSHFSFMLNRMHWLFRSLSWRPYTFLLSLLLFLYFFLLSLCLLLILIHHHHLNRRDM